MLHIGFVFFQLIFAIPSVYATPLTLATDCNPAATVQAAVLAAESGLSGSSALHRQLLEELVAFAGPDVLRVIESDGAETHFSCGLAEDCLVLTQWNLRVLWKIDVAPGTFRVNAQRATTLELPPGTTLRDLPDHGAAAMHTWLSGTPLNPFLQLLPEGYFRARGLGRSEGGAFAVPISSIIGTIDFNQPSVPANILAGMEEFVRAYRKVMAGRRVALLGNRWDGLAENAPRFVLGIRAFQSRILEAWGGVSPIGRAGQLLLRLRRRVDQLPLDGPIVAAINALPAENATHQTINEIRAELSRQNISRADLETIAPAFGLSDALPLLYPVAQVRPRPATQPPSIAYVPRRQVSEPVSVVPVFPTILLPRPQVATAPELQRAYNAAWQLNALAEAYRAEVALTSFDHFLDTVSQTPTGRIISDAIDHARDQAAGHHFRTAFQLEAAGLDIAPALREQFAGYIARRAANLGTFERYLDFRFLGIRTRDRGEPFTATWEVFTGRDEGYARWIRRPMAAENQARLLLELRTAFWSQADSTLRALYSDRGPSRNWQGRLPELVSGASAPASVRIQDQFFWGTLSQADVDAAFGLADRLRIHMDGHAGQAPDFSSGADRALANSVWEIQQNWFNSAPEAGAIPSRALAGWDVSRLVREFANRVGRQHAVTLAGMGVLPRWVIGGSLDRRDEVPAAHLAWLRGGGRGRSPYVNNFVREGYVGPDEELQPGESALRAMSRPATSREGILPVFGAENLDERRANTFSRWVERNNAVPRNRAMGGGIQENTATLGIPEEVLRTWHSEFRWTSEALFLQFSPEAREVIRRIEESHRMQARLTRAEAAGQVFPLPPPEPEEPRQLPRPAPRAAVELPAPEPIVWRPLPEQENEFAIQESRAAATAANRTRAFLETRRSLPTASGRRPTEARVLVDMTRYLGPTNPPEHISSEAWAAIRQRFVAGVLSGANNADRVNGLMSEFGATPNAADRIVDPRPVTLPRLEFPAQAPVLPRVSEMRARVRAVRMGYEALRLEIEIFIGRNTPDPVIAQTRVNAFKRRLAHLIHVGGRAEYGDRMLQEFLYRLNRPSRELLGYSPHTPVAEIPASGPSANGASVVRASEVPIPPVGDQRALVALAGRARDAARSANQLVANLAPGQGLPLASYERLVRIVETWTTDETHIPPAWKNDEAVCEYVASVFERELSPDVRARIYGRAPQATGDEGTSRSFVNEAERLKEGLIEMLGRPEMISEAIPNGVNPEVTNVSALLRLALVEQGGSLFLNIHNPLGFTVFYRGYAYSMLVQMADHRAVLSCLRIVAVDASFVPESLGITADMIRELGQIPRH